MSIDQEANSTIVEELTRGLVFESGVSTADFTFVESIGFLAVKAGGQEVGGIEVAGFMASRGGLYMKCGGYPETVRPGIARDIATETPDDLIRTAQRGLGIVLGNTPLALEQYSTDTVNNEIELWGAVVHPKVDDVRRFAREGIRVKNNELGRDLITRGDLKRWTSGFSLSPLLGTLSVHNLGHRYPEFSQEGVNIQNLGGRVSFKVKEEVVKSPSLRKLGTLRCRPSQ